MCLLVFCLFWIFCVAFTPEPLPHHVPPGWKRSHVAEPSGELDILIALRRDTSQWEQLLMQRADPKSTMYGQWLAKRHILELAAPQQHCVEDVRRWIGTQGTLVGHGDWMRARLSVARLSRLLSTNFYTFVHAEQGNVTRCESYTVPDFLLGCVELVAGVKQLPPASIFRKMRKTRRSHREVVGWSPTDLRNVWNVGTVRGNATNGQIQSVAEFNQGENFSPSDLTTFQRGWKIPEQSVSRVLGPNDPSNPGDNFAFGCSFFFFFFLM